MAVLKRKQKWTRKNYLNVAVPVPVHEEMRAYVFANRNLRGMGHLISLMWQERKTKEKTAV